MKDQYCLRSIPADLWAWLEDTAQSRRQKLNETVIELLEITRRSDPTPSLFAHSIPLRKAVAQAVPFRFIDLFAGIGGFRIGLERLGGDCVFTSERDKFCQKTYSRWFGDLPAGDITAVDPADIPDHDVLAAGFPCQPFSIAGVSKKRSLGHADGFRCERQGNLFFRICDIIDVKRPPVLMLENVKNLRSHDGGTTWAVIQQELRKREYCLFSSVIDAKYWVPQHRERIFIVAFDSRMFGGSPDYAFPDTANRSTPRFKDILEEHPDERYVLTDHLWNYLQGYARKHQAKGNGFGFGMTDLEGISRTLSARYYKDGSEVLIPRGEGQNPRRLTIVEAARLMGFGEVVRAREDVPVSDTQAYKQFGNAVVPAVVEAVGRGVVAEMERLIRRYGNGCLLAGRVRRSRPSSANNSRSGGTRRRAPALAAAGAI